MFILFFSTLVAILDQYTKQLAVERLVEGPIEVVEGFFNLTYVQNSGAAFGIFQNGNMYFLILIPIILIAFFLYMLSEYRKNRLVSLAAALIIGGALGNYIDRVRLGYVIDFLDFKIWPVFNIADSAIVCGTIIFVWYILFIGDVSRNH